MTGRLLAGGIVSLFACGGDSGDPDPVISVGGTYATDVSLGTNTCGNVTVEPRATTVQHTPGALTFSLTHGPLTYSGTLESDGGFTTAPRTVSANGETSTLEVTGQFTVTGFTASVAVDVQRTTPPSTCDYVVNWLGTKQGSPNVIP
jgi:hypothetical protein